MAVVMIEYDRKTPKARALAVLTNGIVKSTVGFNTYDARLLQLSKKEVERYLLPNTSSATDRFWYDRGFSEALLMLDMNDLSKAEARGMYLDDLIKDCGTLYPTLVGQRLSGWIEDLKISK